MSEFITDALLGVNNGPSSTGGGRSESPSQPPPAADQAGSRAGTPGSEATSPLTPPEPWHPAAETVTETERLRCGTGGGSEDEPEHAALSPGHPATMPRRRNVLISLPAETYERLELLVKSSGLPRAYFLTAALVNGAGRVVADLNEGLRVH